MGKIKGNPKPNWRTAGVIGIGGGVGVTHLTVWMANYLKSACGSSVAVIEWNNHEDLRRLGKACAKGTKPGHPFSLLGVDYYAGGTVEDWNYCAGKNYRKILVDMGEISKETLQWCSAFDQKIVVGSFSEWKSDAFVEFLRGRGDTESDWKYATAFGSEEFRKEVEKKCQIKICRIPFSVDAFQITGADMDFFRNWIQS